MSIAIAILGLAFLILVHEAGHFFASLAVGLRPRKFYVGFPPAVVKTRRSGIEYGIGAIPLGGFVSIPGMHRPVPHDAERRFDAAVSEDPGLAGPVDRVKRSLLGDDLEASLGTLDDLEQELNARRLSPVSTKSAEKGSHRASGRARSGRVLEGRNVEAAGRDRRRAGGEHPARDRALHRSVHDRERKGHADRRRGRTGHIRSSGRAQPGDRIVAINGQPVTGSDIRDRHLRLGGRAPAPDCSAEGEPRSCSIRCRRVEADGRRLPPRVLAERRGARPGRSAGSCARGHRES